MCNPVAIGLAVAQGGMTYIGQQQAARTQEKVQRRATEAEQKRYLQEVSATRLRERQEQIAAAQKIQQSATKSREARATARVSAGEAGVAGLSVDSLINDLSRQEAEFNFSVAQQLAFSGQNRALGLTDSQMRSRMNLLSINKPIEQPNLVGALLDGATTGMAAYSFADAAGIGAPKYSTKPPGGYKLESTKMQFTLPE